MTTSKATSSASSNELEVEDSLKTTAGVESFEVNSDFDAMIDDAVKTKEQTIQDEQTQKQSTPDNLTYSPKAAADIALKGLSGAMGLVSRVNGCEIQLTQEVQMIFAAMATPLVMKHGKTIEGLLNPANVDLKSNVPEYLAVGAVAVVGIPAWLQIKQVNALKKAAAKHHKENEVSQDKTSTDSKAEEVAHGD